MLIGDDSVAVSFLEVLINKGNEIEPVENIACVSSRPGPDGGKKQ